MILIIYSQDLFVMFLTFETMRTSNDDQTDVNDKS
jgi:formate hydrogenlyase subunit 3/multisubunit Na+/H+ antiporter MnhD subunit